MKIKHLILAGTFMFSALSIAQKDELKTLKKLSGKDVVAGQDLVSYKDALSKLESVATTDEDKTAASFYKAMLPVLKITSLGANPQPAQLSSLVTANEIAETATGFNSVLDFEKKLGKKVFTDKILQSTEAIRPSLLGLVDFLANKDKVGESSDILYAVYQLTKDQDMLYYAANYAVNAKKYDAALNYYSELKKLNYTGESTVYYAKSILSGKEEAFSTKDERDKLVLLKTHNSPRDEKATSKKAEIYKNTALILLELGKKEEAKAALAQARKEYPENNDLLVYEANLYLELKEYDKYTSLVNEALTKNPNDKQMIFNLGVLSGQGNKLDEAEKYYKKVIEIDPNYVDAYVNLSELMLRADKALVDEMNGLGTSDKDNKRYDVLTKKRKEMFTNVMPILEKANQLKPDDTFVKDTLLSVYRFLELSDKAKALKNK